MPLKLSVSLPGSKQWEVLLKGAGQLLCAGRMRIQEEGNSSAATVAVREGSGPGERQRGLEAKASSPGQSTWEGPPQAQAVGVTGNMWCLGRSTLIPGVTNPSCRPLQGLEFTLKHRLHSSAWQSSSRRGNEHGDSLKAELRLQQRSSPAAWTLKALTSNSRDHSDCNGADCQIDAPHYLHCSSPDLQSTLRRYC